MSFAAPLQTTADRQGAVNTRPLLLQRKCACGGSTGLKSECEECRKNELTMQRAPLSARREDTDRPEVPPIVYEVLRSPGQPLDAVTRDFFASRLGHDFGHVRVHATSAAEESARAVNAIAYTVGTDVVFGAGQYAPGTTAGKKLLAHELAHVVQQGTASSPSGNDVRIDSPNEPGEYEAERVASTIPGAVGPGECPSALGDRSPHGSAHLSRQVAPAKFTQYDETIRKEIERIPKGDPSAAASSKQRLRDLLEKTTPIEARLLHARLSPGPKGDAFAKFFHQRLEPSFRGELLAILVRRSGGGGRVSEERREAAEESKCRVDVRATHAGWTARLAGAKHLFIVHADERGTETAYRAGPNLSWLIDEFHGKYDESFIDWDPEAPSLTVLSGKRACGKDMCFVGELIRIAKAQVPYGLEEPNSNTVVSAVLSACGVARQKPNVWAPGWDGTLDLNPPPAHPGPKTPFALPWMLL